VTDMFCKRMAIIHRKGRERLEELREAHRTESERLLEVFGDVLAAVREATAAEEDGDAGGEPEDSVTPGSHEAAADEDDGDQKVPLQLITAKTRHKSPRTAMRQRNPATRPSQRSPACSAPAQAQPLSPAALLCGSP